MSKYRTVANNQITSSCNELKVQLNRNFESCYKCSSSINQINQQGAVINALVKMMDEFLLDGNDVTNKLLEENTFLKAENETLRKIVAASQKFGIKEDNNNNNIIDES